MTGKPLRRAMRIAGIEPLDAGWVEEFKRYYWDSQFAARMTKEKKILRAKKFAECITATVYALIIATALGAGASLFVALTFVGVAALAVMCGLLLLLAWRGIAIKFKWEARQTEAILRTGMSWKMVLWTGGFSVYPILIPRKELTTAEEIRIRVPEAKFEIEYFVKDPFFKVTLGDEMYYFAHWGEEDAGVV